MVIADLTYQRIFCTSYDNDTYSLLVKGFAGTGKTTLALTILNVLGIKNNFFYISTRISPKQLFQYYPG